MEWCYGGCCLAGLAAWFRCHMKATGVWRDKPRGPLKGVKVLDLTQALTGPFASKLLADMGAEVIRVDMASHPDPIQHLGPAPAIGMAGAYMTINSGKRSLGLDLQKGGLEVFRRLAGTADIVLQSFAPGAAEELGVGYEAVKGLKPDIIYVSISGFGSAGLRAKEQAHDPLIQCLAGLCMEQTDENGPRLVPSALADKLTSLTVTQAIVAALVARDRGAGGQHVEVSMLESLLQFLWLDNYSSQLWQVPCPEGQPPPHFFHRIWRTKDAEGNAASRHPTTHLALGITSDEEWLALCKAIQRPELAEDPRFAGASERASHLAEWVREVQASLSSLSGEEALEALERENVPHAPVQSQEEVLSDRQSRNSELFIRIRHPFLGAFRQPQFPCEFGETGACGSARSPAPVPGEHSAKILAEAGFSKGEAAGLLASGAVLDCVAFAEQTGGDRKHRRLLRFFSSLQMFDKSNLWTAEGAPFRKPPPEQTEEEVELMREEGPFAGLQVLEVGSGLEVSLTGAILADQGAEVIKVEFSPDVDGVRDLGPSPAVGMGAVHMAANRGKRSVVLNPENPRAFDILERLVQNVDAVIINLPVGQAQELGLSYYDLQQKRKGLVYCYVAGFNSKGPRFWDPGHDCLVQALAGGAAACPDRNGEPSLVNTQLADKVAAMFAAISIGAACRMQLRGVVQQVDVDKFGSTVFFNFPDLFQDSVWERPPRGSTGAASLSAFGRLATSSNRQAALGVAAVSDAEFRSLCKALGHSEWLEREDWSTLPGRLRDAAALGEAVDEAFKAMDAASLAASCKEHGVPCAPVLSVEQVLQDPQVLQSKIFETADHPVLGRYRLPRHAAHFSETPARGRTPAPAPGEGMVEHLEACGYDRTKISALVASGAVGAPRPPEPAGGWAGSLFGRLAIGTSAGEEAWKQAGFRASALRSLQRPGQ